jgi:hypothetical protein
MSVTQSRFGPSAVNWRLTSLADADPVTAELIQEAEPLFWGHHLRGRCPAEDLVLLLKVTDLLPCRHELRGLDPSRRGLEPAVDQVLPLPAVQARLRDPEQPGDLRDGTA